MLVLTQLVLTVSVDAVAFDRYGLNSPQLAAIKKILEMEIEDYRVNHFNISSLAAGQFITLDLRPFYLIV